MVNILHSAQILCTVQNIYHIITSHKYFFKLKIQHTSSNMWFICDVTWTLLSFVFRDENQIIQKYFWEGFSYMCITKLLHEYHRVNISTRTLRRRLQNLGLARRKHCPPLLTVWNTIQMELQGPGCFAACYSNSSWNHVNCMCIVECTATL